MKALCMVAILILASCDKPADSVKPTTKTALQHIPIEDDSMADIEFELVDLGEFPALKTKEFFGEQIPDAGLFADEINARMQQKFDKEIEQMELFNGGASRNPLAFIYFKDLSIRGAELTADPNLTSWLAAMAKSFDGSSRHRVTGSGANSSRFSGWSELEKDPAGWAKKSAPRSHFKTEIADAKATFFKFGVVESAPSFDKAQFDSAFKDLISKRNAQITPPNPARLDALELAVGTALPKDVRALYEATDGIKELFHGFDLLSVEEVAREHAGWKKIYDDWTLDDLQSNQTAQPGIYAVYCTPRWVPFVDMVGGNFLAIDLGPAAGGTYGQIIVFGSDVDGKRRVAASLTEFLQKASTYDGSESHELFSVFGRLKY